VLAAALGLAPAAHAALAGATGPGRPILRESLGEPALVPAGGLVPEWQWPATRSDLVPAWVQRAASRITIAVVDTGFDPNAPDLRAKQPTVFDVTGGDGVDVVGHGTFVASIAAGSVTNGDGIAGFGGDARLLVAKASRGTSSVFTDSDEATAIRWAVDHGAQIVNLSLGGTTSSAVEQAAVQHAIDRGVLLVAAAGNNAGSTRTYPAALLGTHGLAVGASTRDGVRAPFSSAGAFVSVAAPGVSVLGALASTAPASRQSRFPLRGASGLYGLDSGTSVSAPQVAGAAALVWAANPGLTRDEVVATIERTASGRGVRTPGLGYGILDVAAAVTGASTSARPAPPKPKARTVAHRLPQRGRPG
jgi:serine protease